MSNKLFSFLLAVWLVSTVGCTSHSRIDNPQDPRVRNGSFVLVKCGDGESYIFERVAVRSEVITGKGMKHDRRTDQWEHFDGSVPIRAVSGIYIQQFDPERTMGMFVGILVHATVAIGLLFFWSGTYRFRSWINWRRSTASRKT